MIATLTSVMPECFQGRILYCNNFLKIQTHYCYFLKKRKQRKQSSNQAYHDCRMQSIFHYRDAKKISFYYFGDTKLCAKQKNTHEFHIHCWDHVCKVNEWYLVDCFHHEFRFSAQIMVCDYCITECNKFSTCNRLLMALWATFFTIENI